MEIKKLNYCLISEVNVSNELRVNQILITFIYNYYKCL